jgi:hypothetical protein
MIYIILILMTVLIFYDSAFALKCNKCHKEDKVLSKIIEERKIKLKDELFNILRNGRFAKLHKGLTDEEIIDAAKILNLK